MQPILRLSRAFSRLAALGLATVSAAMAQDIELYDQPRFGGVRLTLSSDTPDVADYGLGGRVGSVVVRQGSWEFCTRPQFAGACITVGPGRYAELPTALRGSLASLRNTAGTSVGTAPVVPSVPPVPPAATPQAPAALVLYRDAGFSGGALEVREAQPSLSRLNFNDTASSLEVRRWRWQLCQHADHGGECRVFGPGRHVLAGRLHDGVSSLRPVFGANDQPLPASGGVMLWEHSDFRGRELLVTESTLNLGALAFNDRASALEVIGGRWELCTDADFRGRCFLLEPGQGPQVIPRELNDQLTSLRPLPPHQRSPLR
jgi:hypothetical protein